MSATTTNNDMAQTTRRTRGLGWSRYLKRALLGLLILIAALLMSGILYQTIASWSDSRAYPAPGQLIDVGGYKLHLYCMGEGNPTVILDAGGGFTSSSWAWIQPEIAKTNRVCAYDRAGWGWSEPSAVGYAAIQNARELDQLVTNANVPPPYILVGHSLGGLYGRVYAAQYPNKVVGLVQVDASHPDAWRRMGLREGANVDPNLLAIGPLAARLGLLRLMDALSPNTGLAGQLPEHAERAMRAALVTAQFAETAQKFDAALPVILEQARAVKSLGSVPLVIVTTGDQPEMSAEQNRTLHELQRELQHLSANSVYLSVAGANHVSLVHNRQYAQVTTDAIRRLIQAVRAGKPLAQP